MEAIWWTGDDQKLSYRTDVCPDNLLTTDVKVKVSYSGVCGSDFSYMKGNMGKHNAKQDGVILGHEFSGVIVQVGSDVDDLKVGDRVAVDPNSCCSQCPTDARDPQFCEMNEALGVKRNGGWAGFCVAPRAQVYKLPDDLSLLQAALAEPFSCVLRGWKRIDEDHLKQRGKALVEGAGIIGSLFCCLLRHHGFDDVTVAEINEDRREAMKKFLPTNYKVLHPEAIASGDVDFDENGFNLIIDCTGNVKVFQENFRLAKRGGVILGFGCCPAGSMMQVEPFQIYWKELKILGSFLNPRCFPEALKLLSEMSSAGWLNIRSLGIEIFPLSHFQEALNRLRTRAASKVLFAIHQ